jgi:hypothetical protein
LQKLTILKIENMKLRLIKAKQSPIFKLNKGKWTHKGDSVILRRREGKRWGEENSGDCMDKEMSG